MFKAKLSQVRISARKARLVADTVRGCMVAEALDRLRVTRRKASPLLIKLINSAVANATYASTVDIDRLRVQTLTVDAGPVLKRFLPRAQGRGTPLRKKTAHFFVELKEI